MDSISVNMTLLNEEDIPESIREKLILKTIIREKGKIWFRKGDYVFCCENNQSGKEMAQALAFSENPGFENIKDPWKAILKDGKNKDKSIRDEKRCVIVFSTGETQENHLKTETFELLAPTERGDVITETETAYIALVKRVKDHSEDDLIEFAAAVIETIETETGIRAWAGIGKITEETTGLPESYMQATEAIRIGKCFRPGEYVYAYNRMQAERIISAIPEEIRIKLREELTGAWKRMTPEILETARVYLQNDLNLTTTSRQLYIHRNTLIYRLDKIRKETGLDLRKFRDAAAFQIISQIAEQSLDK